MRSFSSGKKFRDVLTDNDEVEIEFWDMAIAVSRLLGHILSARAYLSLHWSSAPARKATQLSRYSVLYPLAPSGTL